MDEEYSQFDEDYEYYITPFGNYRLILRLQKSI
jgi:hypothetical protein|nr:MAG TPA: hypothetical protein [Bacteriophage sp.]